MKSPVGDLSSTALNIRKSIIEMLVPKVSHHIGCSLSIVEILTVLYFDILRVDPKNPNDKNRDIFILSKGHAAAALYATLAQRGFFSQNILKRYDTNGGILPEHVTKIVPGVEVSTGSLGHGLPIGIGFALSNREIRNKNMVCVLMSDGELNEGSNWEAIMFAGFHKLDNLVVIIDANGMQGYGATKKVLDLGQIKDKISPFGWNTYETDGHDIEKLKSLFRQIKKKSNGKPHFIIAHTIKGKGVPQFEGKFESHYYSLDEITKKKILSEFIKL